MTYGSKAHDPSRTILGWQRLSTWSTFEKNTQRATVMVFRCPIEVREKLCNNFGGDAGIRLREHPMLVHLFILQHISIYAANFQHKFADPLYKLVCIMLPYEEKNVAE
jgi:hypothetical protein